MANKIKNNENSSHPADNLNPKQRLFLTYYTDPKSKTFGNALQSYKKAYNIDNDNLAGVKGHYLLKNGKIQTAYQQLCAEYGLSDKVRLEALSNIVRGAYQSKSVKRTYTVDKETGKRVLSSVEESEKTPTAREITGAVAIVEKIDLEYKKAGMNTLKEISDSAKHLFSNLKDVTDNDIAGVIELVETGEGGEQR